MRNITASIAAPRRLVKSALCYNESVQYKVPQNIDMEDRIFGPLTLFQFLSLLIGGMVVYVLFLALRNVSLPIFFIAGLPIALVTLAFTFVRVQDRPFPTFLGYFILYLLNPKRRVWAKGAQPQKIITEAPAQTAAHAHAHKHLSRAELAATAKVLDKPMGK